MKRVRLIKELGTMFDLGRWLGPWADGQASPRDVRREEVSIPARRAEDRPFSAFLYRSTARGEARATGSLLLVPGLHYLGPLDPRMDRFARVLAASGLVVLAPRLPDFASLVLGKGVFGDLERALTTLAELPRRPAGRPGVFSISFGSLPSLWLAAESAVSSEVGSLVVFGGYADFHDTLRFCIHGRPGAAHDPLNRPVVFMNLLPWLDGRPEDPGPLFAAMRRYVEATWGKPEMKTDGKWQSVARAIAADLPEDTRPLFFAVTGVEGDTARLFESALERAGSHFDWLDPTPLLERVRCPVHLIHGADDDVIPYEQAHTIAKGLPEGVLRGVHVTGLYGHTHKSGGGMGLGDVPAMAREVATLVRMLAAVAKSGAY
jgi:pimeloyl-ACP methyl ester carboxylesterase